MLVLSYVCEFKNNKVDFSFNAEFLNYFRFLYASNLHKICFARVHWDFSETAINLLNVV